MKSKCAICNKDITTQNMSRHKKSTLHMLREALINKK